MKRHSFKLFAAILLFSTGCFAADTVRLATFNCEFLVRSKVHVKFGLPFDLNEPEQTQWAQPGFRDGKFNEAAKAVAGKIKIINADVISLVEVGDDQDVEELRQEVKLLGLDYPNFAVCESSDNTTGQHVAVFSKRPLNNVVKKLEGRESYDKELDDDDTEENTGVSKGMHVTFAAGGAPVHLYIVHLASERGGNEQDAQRVAQASIVRRTYLPQLNNGAHVIVAGDLNDHRGQPALKRIRGRDDIFADLIQTGEVNFFPPDKLDTRWTYQFQGRREQIDHLLLSDSIKEACKSGGVKSEVLENTNPLVSDHRPFVVNLEFR